MLSCGRRNIRSMCAAFLFLVLTSVPVLAQTPSRRANEAVIEGGAKTIILVRHAEKDTDTPRDPDLTAAGSARAVALADALLDMRIDHVITSEFQRTRATALVVASHAGLTPQVIPAGTGEEAMQAVVGAVKARPAGESILIVGHSNTIPRLVGALGGSKIPDLKEYEYDSIFVLILNPGDPARTMRLRFGAPNR